MIRAIACIFALICAACAPENKEAGTPDNAADLLIFGGPIYTGNDDAPMAMVVAVKDGAISAVGAENLLDDATGPDTTLVDLKGATLFPGFTDSHVHLIGVGMRELSLNLEGVGSIEELLEIIAANVQAVEDNEIIVGRGWIETGWPEGRMPNRDDLDPISPANPVLLIRADGHALAANSLALDAAGIDDATPDTAGGRIERDANGRATGILIDDAMAPAFALVGQPTEEKRREALEIGSRVYAAYGWASIHNVSVNPDDVALIEDGSKAGVIPIRVYNAIEPRGFEALSETIGDTRHEGRVITRAVKMYVDGALGSRGAALEAPYTDQPDTDGLLVMTKEQAMPVYKRALETGVQIATHAIGDRGNRLILDWYEEALAAVPPENRAVANPRWRIEHSQILNVSDIPRFANLGVIASMQPSHAIGDLYFAPDRLGADRLNGAYAWRSLIDAGAVIAGGSDAPVERGNPLIEFYAAVARRGLDGYQDENWRPDQAVSRAEALKMFTAWPAYASFQEDSLGTIEVGKRADFSAFSADLMTIPEAEILDAQAVMTVVNGEIIYQAEDSGGQAP